VKKIAVVVISLGFFLASALLVLAYNYFYSPLSEQSEEVVFEVKPGPFYMTAKELEEKGIIPSRRLFTYFAQLRGDIKNIQVGEFSLNRNYSAAQVLDKLTSSDYVKYSITIPEGYNIFEIASIVEKAGLTTADDFLAVARDKDFASNLVGISLPGMEGFLFPDTYNFSKTDSAKKMVESMFSQFKANYEEIMAQNNQLKMPLLAHITLASMIEKETGAAFERPTISSVFHNRLNKRMRLQSDPTIIYGVMMEEGVWLKNIRKKHILQKTAYNTYTIPALPPSPIANPGRESIAAALNPADTDYLYFVSQNDGTHVFTKTYKEHKAAVRKYQLNQKAREGKSWRDLKQK
tara:strand:- start:4739 stop:5785 length:1047 start_codon:yes stop_codon:yes gene_type:complete